MGLEVGADMIVGREDPLPSGKENAPKEGIYLGCPELGKEESRCE